MQSWWLNIKNKIDWEKEIEQIKTLHMGSKQDYKWLTPLRPIRTFLRQNYASCVFSQTLHSVLVMFSIEYFMMMTLLAYLLVMEVKHAQSIWSAPPALADLFFLARRAFLDLSSFNWVTSQLDGEIGIGTWEPFFLSLTTFSTCRHHLLL